MTPAIYTLELTAEEYTALQWLEARGYTAGLIQHATDIDEIAERAACRVVLWYTEPAAWAVRDAAYGDGDEIDQAFATCAGPALAGKMFAFLDGIE